MEKLHAMIARGEKSVVIDGRWYMLAWERDKYMAAWEMVRLGREW